MYLVRLYLLYPCKVIAQGNYIRNIYIFIRIIRGWSIGTVWPIVGSHYLQADLKLIRKLRVLTSPSNTGIPRCFYVYIWHQIDEISFVRRNDVVPSSCCTLKHFHPYFYHDSSNYDFALPRLLDFPYNLIPIFCKHYYLRWLELNEWQRILLVR